MPKRKFRLLNIQTKETYLTSRGDLADHILDTCRHYSDKILLCDLVAKYVGADILAGIQTLDRICMVSRTRGALRVALPARRASGKIEWKAIRIFRFEKGGGCLESK